MGVQAIIVDTAGTTTDFQFIKDTLFSYSADALPEFLEHHHNDFAVSNLLADIRAHANEPDADLPRLVELIREWIAADNKLTALKTLQGLVWKQGYLKGEFKGHVYADAAEALKTWKAAGKRLYSYSSSSADAQDLLFKHSNEGDLSALFYGHFDTNLGQKKTVQAYKNILNVVSLWPKHVLFVSDDVEELNAARDAGLRTCQVVRGEGVRRGDHNIVDDFSQLKL
ncbi:acireductone synthase [Ferrimonas balearica]|uniref:acireductone synthase n=1 Tax=Ferrimonas balearica TaxID=44012 RepID=UPI001F453A93|nr:acireductone synthase [Ferrimonas balearica]MBY6019486.1 acireductone synthase [Halomonas denitrificans]MBY6096551.1 acireductone synthase [Ferrimonas balearica]